MNSGNYSDDDVDTRARDVAKKAVLRNLEDKMEILFCTIQRKQKDIVNLAGTCSWNSDVLIKHAYFLVSAKGQSLEIPLLKTNTKCQLLYHSTIAFRIVTTLYY